MDINKEIQMSSLTDLDTELLLGVFNQHQEELPLYQCTNCKKLTEIQLGDNECKHCNQYIYWKKL